MRQAKQLRLAYLTSCRELLRDEQVGPCAPAPVSGYRASLLESLISAVSSPPLDALLSLVLVLFDDDPAEISDRTAALTLFGDAGAPPVSLPSPAVERVSSLAFRVSPSAPQERHSEAKAQIDQAILRALIRHSVDVLLCDSYMLVFGDSFLRGFPNLALNIHPGITAETDPGWCKGATPHSRRPDPRSARLDHHRRQAPRPLSPRRTRGGRVRRPPPPDRSPSRQAGPVRRERTQNHQRG